jgi:hypothetical protein
MSLGLTVSDKKHNTIRYDTIRGPSRLTVPPCCEALSEQRTLSAAARLLPPPRASPGRLWPSRSLTDGASDNLRCRWRAAATRLYSSRSCVRGGGQSPASSCVVRAQTSPCLLAGQAGRIRR